MNNEYRLYIYAFLSRVMSNIPDRRFITDLKNNESLLEIIGEETYAWVKENDEETLYEAMNVDYSSMFILNTQPVESFVLDAKNETLVGLQNPVMAFYFTHGFEVNMDQTDIMAPDHLGIEFAFMQMLIYRNEHQPQIDFLDQHLFPWVVPYMMGMKSMAETPFYRDMCDFIVEFLSSDYEFLRGDNIHG
ncbi:MAG: molecular chaperone TorD family protein [Sulfuricurvum sp.]|jgi:TorA maturation chaperone TorD|uniref:TorD/DmsD family molecular chaperone n=1 Tax=Sulfuricurvum sp. TaxID=2025608 RepID=UPI0025D905D8|nr:molecular chaperone TorD family protein [Sulfuricurvum sp.]MCI4406631.1 molecular chaperone TorD family protein [Sulfuricurvum sp.]